VALAVGLFFGYFAYGSARNLADQPDPDVRCAPGVTSPCFAARRATVELADDPTLRVSYDDGRRSAELSRVVNVTWDELPPVGTRVLLEWWGGEVVAVHWTERDTRYKTARWSVAENLIGVLIWLAIALAATVVAVNVSLVRAASAWVARRRQA
jgi:hypothetical protein